MKQLALHELKTWIADGRDFLLLDVRESWERDVYNIGGLHIPMGELMSRLPEVPRERDVVIYCERGIRSVIAMQRLEALGFRRVYNLSGGMKAWQESF